MPYPNNADKFKSDFDDFFAYNPEFSEGVINTLLAVYNSSPTEEQNAIREYLTECLDLIIQEENPFLTNDINSLLERMEYTQNSQPISNSSTIFLDLTHNDNAYTNSSTTEMSNDLLIGVNSGVSYNEFVDR